MADPHVWEDPSVTIGATEMICKFRKVTLTPEDNMADIETFCTPGDEKPSSTRWTFEAEVILDYDTAGSWNALHALRKTKPTVVVKPADTAVAVTIPSASFSMRIPSIPFVDAAIGEATIFTLTCPVVGEPVFATSA